MQKINLPELTPQEVGLATFYKLPASQQVIVQHLQRLAIHKRMDRNDPDRDAFLFADFARRLDGVTEVEVFAACEHFTEGDTDPFFPSFAKLKAWLSSEFAHCAWSMFHGRGND